MIVRARVRRGRLLVDEPTDLPGVAAEHGAEVALEIVDDVLADEMSAEERARLEASIEAAREQAARGEGVDGEAYLRRLRARAMTGSWVTSSGC